MGTWGHGDGDTGRKGPVILFEVLPLNLRGPLKALGLWSVMVLVCAGLCCLHVLQSLTPPCLVYFLLFLEKNLCVWQSPRPGARQADLLEVGERCT